MADEVVVVQVTQPVVRVTAPGPQGAPGTFTPGNIAYTYIQAIASAEWVINHNLGFEPTAVVLDSSGTQCEGTFSYPSKNTMVITFTAPFTGTAYVV